MLLLYMFFLSLWGQAPLFMASCCSGPRRVCGGVPIVHPFSLGRGPLQDIEQRCYKPRMLRLKHRSATLDTV